MQTNQSDFRTTSAGDGTVVPVISFTGGNTPQLSVEHFEFGDNISFDAYYDGSHKLIFVLDKSATPALMVIRPDEKQPERKWQDILANDYGLDLETIRPKENNKYQKLDTEYEGLGIYNRIILSDGAPADIAAVLNFRNAAARRSARLRLDAAEKTIYDAEYTIKKTEESYAKTETKIKELKLKVAAAKKKIGKEPTKESAAKVLKAESQIDNENEKLKRARLRLRRAKSRLDSAQNDAYLARQILGETEQESEMAEEVKPLFDNQPEDNFGDGSGFKPIEFGTSAEQNPAPRPEVPFEPMSLPPEFAAPNYNRNISDMETLPAPEEPSFAPQIRPVMNTAQPAMEQQPAPAVAPTYTPAPPATRPASLAAPVAPIPSAQKPERKRPGLSYYILLLLLIILSIFTLWLYKQRSIDGVPNLAAPTETVQTAQPTEPLPAPIEYQPEPIVLPPAEEPVETEDPFIVAEPAYNAKTVGQALGDMAGGVVNKPEYGVHGPVATKLVPIEEYYEDEIYYDEVPTEEFVEEEVYEDDQFLPDGFPTPEEFFKNFDESQFFQDAAAQAAATGNAGNVIYEQAGTGNLGPTGNTVPAPEEFFDEGLDYDYDMQDGTEVQEDFSHFSYESGSVE